MYEISSGEVNARYTQTTNESGKTIYILHAGSRISSTVNSSARDWVKRKRQELETAEMLVDSVVHTEVEFDSPSALACFCKGGSESGPRFIQSSQLISGNAGNVSDTANEADTDAAACVHEVGRPEPQEPDNDTDGEYYEMTKSGVNARYKIVITEKGKNFVLLSGSRVNPTVAPSAPDSVKKRREELTAEGKLVDFVITADVDFTSASALAGFCVGGSKSGTEFIEKDSRLVSGKPAAEADSSPAETDKAANTSAGSSSGIIGENRLIK